MIIPKIEKEEVIITTTNNCETLIKQTHTKTGETLEFIFTQPRQTFSFQTAINLGTDSNWMIGLIALEIYNFVFEKTEK